MIWGVWHVRRHPEVAAVRSLDAKRTVQLSWATTQNLEQIKHYNIPLVKELEVAMGRP